MRAVSDPAGSAAITVIDPSNLNRYRFGHKTTDFLICSNCGTFVAAVMMVGDQLRSVVNVRGVALTDLLANEPVAMDFEQETEAGRIARREQNWTPTTLTIASHTQN